MGSSTQNLKTIINSIVDALINPVVSQTIGHRSEPPSGQKRSKSVPDSTPANNPPRGMGRVAMAI